MTKIKILKRFFKKYFDYEPFGNTISSVVEDFMDNVDDIGGKGGKTVETKIVEFVTREPVVAKYREHTIITLPTTDDIDFEYATFALQDFATVTSNILIQGIQYSESEKCAHMTIFPVGVEDDITVPAGAIGCRFTFFIQR